MFVTFATEDYAVTQELELDDSMNVSELKGLLEAILGIPANNQVFICNGKELAMGGTLSSIGIGDKDMVIVINAKKKVGGQPLPNSFLQGANGFPNSKGPLFKAGMSLEEVMHFNKNPAHVVQIVQGNEYLLKQARFHDEELAAIFDKSPEQATKELRKYLMLRAALSASKTIVAQNKEAEMRTRRDKNPNDKEAIAYFAEKKRKEIVQQEYFKVMRDYPECMTKVLMLYINVVINKKPVQAFVDTGAGTSVISLKFAKHLELDHLIDERFASRVVGVGSAKTLGRIHIAEFVIEGNFFPITLTVLDSEKGFGDKNMDFILGLDMLKRHGCVIDLFKGMLMFRGVKGNMIETPFLHEKDLPEVKGGTKDFDPNKPHKNQKKEDREE